MVRDVGTKRPSLVPLFRSTTQVDVLAVLFSPGAQSLTISELAARVGAPVSTVSREVAKLAGAGIVRVHDRGRAKFVSANRELPYARPLTEMLETTVGADAAVAEVFERVADIELVAIFGSWAARRLGEPGPPPHDLDLLIVGDPSALAVARAAAKVERAVGVAVNPVTVGTEEWDAAEIKARPLVTVVTRQRSRA